MLLGNGDGTFRNAVNYATCTEPLKLALGDFDGDLDLDLTTANRFDVSVLLGNGNGAFQPASSFGIGNFPTSVAVGYFNDDGLLDLGLTSNDEYDSEFNAYVGFSYANVMLGDGAGGFSGPGITNLTYGFYPSAAVADFNADVQAAILPLPLLAAFLITCLVTLLHNLIGIQEWQSPTTA